MPDLTREQKKEKVRRRIRAATDPESYSYRPEMENQDHVKNDEFQLVAIYARVSTEDPAQTSSFELQQKYYVDLVARHPKWVLVKIYSDEGKSGTTTAHREGFREMLEDAYAGKINLIIVKNISRFARNVLDFLSTIRKLTEKRIGVLFESEGIYSLNDVNHMTLSFHATIAEEESRVRSRSMETSLRMRLDHGLPLTPELLGFIKGEDGKLIKNPETYKIPKLMFYMYLYGYSTQQIATTLTKLSKRTYLGNLKWTSTGVAKSLRNERYCGDVLTRKRFRVFAPDVDEQKSFKNIGQKPQSYYRKEHEQIISYDDFVAVQRIMDNARFGGTSLLPELRVIPEGLLKGYVIIHPKWGSFTMDDYMNASKSVEIVQETEITEMTGEDGAFDLRGYEVADYQLFSDIQTPWVSLQQSEVRFGLQCIKDVSSENFVELLVHPQKRMLAVRPTTKDNRYAVQWATGVNDQREARPISCRAFIDTVFAIFGWKTGYRYKLYGRIYRDENNAACIFHEEDVSVYIQKEMYLASRGEPLTGTLLNQSGKYIRAIKGDFTDGVGVDYYVEKSRAELENLTQEEWKTRIEGQLCRATVDRLNVTPYEELRAFIKQELGDLFEEVQE